MKGIVMITPVSFNSVQNFKGTIKKFPQQQKKAEAPKESQKHSPVSPMQAGAGVLAALVTLGILHSCKNAPKPPVHIDPPASQTQAGECNPQPYAFEETGEQSSYYEEKHEEDEKAFAISNGIDSFVGIDLDNDVARALYKDIKTAFQNVGSAGMNQLIGACDEFDLNIPQFLAVIVQQGGIPELSSGAAQDVKDKFPELGDATPARKAAAYYRICLDRSEGNAYGAAKKFTGREQDLMGYATLIEKLSGDMMFAIADNDAYGAYLASGASEN